MNCRKVNQLLSAYMDGELCGVDQRQVFEHLARCPECDQEYQSFLQMKRMLGCMRTQQPSPDLQARISYALTWEENQAANRTPSMLWMRMRMRMQDLFTSPQGWGLAAVAVLGIYVVVHRLPAANATTPQSTIVWQTTPNQVTELTRNLEPTAADRFSRPPLTPFTQPVSNNPYGLSPVTQHNFFPAQPENNEMLPYPFQRR